MNLLVWLEKEWLTIASIVLSGFISLVISAYYYHKGNRNNLRMTVIFPIVSLLEDSYSRKNYNSMFELTKEYSLRYMNKKELKCLTELVTSYKEISYYDDARVDAECLKSYFDYVLEKNGICVKPVPVQYEDEIVYYDYPDNYHFMLGDLEKILLKYDYQFENIKCKENIISIFLSFCKECYGVSDISFFEDYSLEEVLSKSKVRVEWNEKFENIRKTKEKFLSLHIVQEIKNNK